MSCRFLIQAGVDIGMQADMSCGWFGTRCMPAFCSQIVMGSTAEVPPLSLSTTLLVFDSDY